MRRCDSFHTMRKHERRRVSGARRSAYISARISEHARHNLEVLSLLHHRSLSSIIEAGIDRLVGLDVGRLGAFRAMDWDEETRCEVGMNYAVDTWAPEEWLRKFKMSVIEPKKFLTPTEEKFWSEVIRDRDRYWLPGDPANLSDEDRRRLGVYILRGGIPNEPAIQKAWEDFKRNDEMNQDSSSRHRPFVAGPSDDSASVTDD